MSHYQIAAACLLLGVCAWTYLPSFSLRLPSLPKPKKSDSLTQIAQVLAIRDSAVNPKVTDACNQLLQALIG